MSIPAQSSETAAAEPYDYAAYAAWWHSVYGAPQIPQPQNETVTVNGQSQPAPPASFEQQKALYVGNLDTRVNEGLLSDVFSTAGMVSNVKIVVDRNYQHGGINYGFVEFFEHRAADLALQTLNGRRILDQEIRVNWAFQGTQNKEDTTGHFHVFIGDLTPEITEATLSKAFAAFGSLSDARIMWDPATGKSRGYGFVSFRDKIDAEQAISTMSGEWLGSRQIRVNWANQKTGAPGAGGNDGSASSSAQGQTYESVLAASSETNSTVYVGNLAPGVGQEALIPYFQQYGYIMEVRIQTDRGFGFVKMDTHHSAAMAIVNLSGSNIYGRTLRCSWGKDRDGPR